MFKCIPQGPPHPSATPSRADPAAQAHTPSAPNHVGAPPLSSHLCPLLPPGCSWSTWHDFASWLWSLWRHFCSLPPHSGPLSTHVEVAAAPSSCHALTSMPTS